MRDFFLQLLNGLDKLTGIKQLDRLTSTKDPKKEINDLLDILCKTCQMFGYIPDEDKKRIINESILTETEFTGLNARVIFKWLDKAKGLYFGQSNEQISVPEDYKPLTGEARELKIKEWLDSLQGIGQPAKMESKGTQIKSSLANIEVPEKKYTPPSADYLYERDMHIAWIKACFDPITQDKLPGYLPENEWRKLNFK